LQLVPERGVKSEIDSLEECFENDEGFEVAALVMGFKVGGEVMLG
jgi:hypothetical protein